MAATNLQSKVAGLYIADGPMPEQRDEPQIDSMVVHCSNPNPAIQSCWTLHSRRRDW